MNYKTTCPSCGGNDFWVTPRNEIRGYCYHCSYITFNDGVYKRERVRHEDIDSIRKLYTELANLYHDNMADDARKYLHSRGITDQNIKDYLIGFCSDDIVPLYKDRLSVEAGIATKDCKPFLANRIIFPYIVNGVVTDMRGRKMNNNDDSPRYLSAFGGSYYRGAEYCFAYGDDTELITEGEIKTILARNAGIKTCGMPGITNIRRYANYKIACLDRDSKPAARYAVARSLEKLADRYPHLKVCTIPKIGMGLDDYILEYGADAFRSLFERSLPYETWRYMYA